MMPRPKSNESGDQIWDALVAEGPVSVGDIAQLVGLTEGAVRRYLRAWRTEGFAHHTKTGHSVKWQVAPYDAAFPASPVPATPPEAIWRVMRALGRFSASDIQLVLRSGPLQVSERVLHEYIRALLPAGYLRVLVRAEPARGILARYQLVRDTGPLPSAVERRQVVRDRNEDQVCYVKGARL